MTRLKNLSWIEFERLCIRESECIALLPIGSIEQHGPHLPLGTDLMIADKLADIIAERALERGFRVIVLEPVPVTVSIEWSGNPGTLWVQGSAFQEYVKSYIKSVARNNIRKIIVLNSHGGNVGHLLGVLKDAVYELGGEHKIYLVNWWEFVGDTINRIFETKFFHADEVETSLAMALGIELREDLGKGEEIKRSYSERWHDLDLSRRPRLYFFSRDNIRFEKGSFGRPDLASREKGEILLREFIERFMEFLEDLSRGRI
ncbi:MAG: creatininase family protein [Sulfolobales archaeon]